MQIWIHFAWEIQYNKEKQHAKAACAICESILGNAGKI
jgi:hypothetical protein